MIIRTASGLLGLFVAIVVLQHVLVPDLTPTTHMLSEYANAKAGWLMEIGFSAWAVSFALTAAAVLARPRDPAGIVLGVLLLIAALGMAGTAAAHTQTIAGQLPPGETLHTEGRIHDLASLAVLLAFFPAAIASVLWLPHPHWFPAVAIGSLLVCATLVADFAIFGVDADGLRQRIELACGIVWQAALLSRIAGRPAPQPG